MERKMRCFPLAHHTFLKIVLRIPLPVWFPELDWYRTTGQLVIGTLHSLDLSDILSFHSEHTVWVIGLVLPQPSEKAFLCSYAFPWI